MNTENFTLGCSARISINISLCSLYHLTKFQDELIASHRKRMGGNTLVEMEFSETDEDQELTEVTEESDSDSENGDY